VLKHHALDEHSDAEAHAYKSKNKTIKVRRFWIEKWFAECTPDWNGEAETI